YSLSLHDALPISGIARANRSPFRFPKSIIALDLIQKQILFDLNQAIVPLPLPNALAFGVKHRKSDPPLVLHHAKDASSFHSFFDVFLATLQSRRRAIQEATTVGWCVRLEPCQILNGQNAFFLQEL